MHTYSFSQFVRDVHSALQTTCGHDSKLTPLGAVRTQTHTHGVKGETVHRHDVTVLCRNERSEMVIRVRRTRIDKRIKLECVEWDADPSSHAHFNECVGVTRLTTSATTEEWADALLNCVAYAG